MEMEVWESSKWLNLGKQVSEFEPSRRKARTLKMKNTIIFFLPGANVRSSALWFGSVGPVASALPVWWSLKTHQISLSASFDHVTMADPVRRLVGKRFSDWLKSPKPYPELGWGQLNHSIGK